MSLSLIIIIIHLNIMLCIFFKLRGNLPHDNNKRLGVYSEQYGMCIYTRLLSIYWKNLDLLLDSDGVLY